MIQNLPWTESPFFATELNNSSLSAEDKAFVKHFADEGYAIFDTHIPHSLMDETINQLDPDFDKITDGNMRIQDAWKYNENVRHIASLDIVYEKLRLLYKREPLPFQTLNFPVGTQQKTHSDMIHFNSIPERFMCGVWVAFEDINSENGPLHYYPQSHKLPFYDMIDIGVKGSDNIETKKAMMAYVEDYEIFIEKMIEALELRKSTLNIKKGQAIIWSANLLHGGEKILRPGATRHSQVTHYYFEECMYFAPRLSDIAINKLFLTDLYNIKTGEKIINKYFGETVKPTTKLYLHHQAAKQLSKISHLFPRSVVDRIRSMILR
jgi:hypothetical protein